MGIEVEPTRGRAALLPKPPSNMSKGWEGAPFFNNNDHALLRNNFTITTWLLLGSTFQALLLLLPIRPAYVLAPPALLLGYRCLNAVLMGIGLRRNQYIDGTKKGRYIATYPTTPGVKTANANGDICVLFLTARSNHPLGLFAPGFKDLSDHLKNLMSDLETKAPDNGFLGASSYSNVCDRTAAGESMNIFYFRSYEQMQKFAHEEAHRKVWRWWNNNLSRQRHLSIGQEIFFSPAGKWSTMYTNCHPSNFGSTLHYVSDEKGGGSWMSPLVGRKVDSKTK